MIFQPRVLDLGDDLEESRIGAAEQRRQEFTADGCPALHDLAVLVHHRANASVNRPHHDRVTAVASSAMFASTFEVYGGYVDGRWYVMGAQDPDYAEVLDEIAGPGPGTVIGTGKRIDPVSASLANALMVRVMDYNDIYWKQDPSHPSDIIPAAMAAAEEDRTLLCPKGSGAEAAWVGATQVIGAATLADVVHIWQIGNEMKRPRVIARRRHFLLDDFRGIAAHMPNIPGTRVYIRETISTSNSCKLRKRVKLAVRSLG